MVSSSFVPASTDKDGDASLSVLVVANASLSQSVAALTEQVAALSLTVASLTGMSGNHNVAVDSPSATPVASTAAESGADNDDNDDNHLSYISEPDENYSNFAAITSAPSLEAAITTSLAPAVAPAVTVGPTAPGTNTTYHALGKENVAPLVIGARGAIFNRQPSQQVALLHFNEARTQGHEWNGNYFAPRSLKELGLRIQLGHPCGEHCTNPQPAFDDAFTIIDSMCVHEVSLDFCGCKTAKLPIIQLLCHRLFPATSVAPRTAATFAALDHFHMLSLEGKVSAFEFWRALA
ncbi:CxC2 domain-containing protein [Salix suchowensis]|nr:CxC2 domain-containing protein [Salix suchowensis]